VFAEQHTGMMRTRSMNMFVLWGHLPLHAESQRLRRLVHVPRLERIIEGKMKICILPSILCFVLYM